MVSQDHNGYESRITHWVICFRESKVNGSGKQEI